MKYVKHGKSSKDQNYKVVVFNKKNEKVTYLLSEGAKKTLDDSNIKEGDEFFNNVDAENRGVNKNTTPITITDITLSSTIKAKEVKKVEVKEEKVEVERHIKMELTEVVNRLQGILKKL